MRKKQDNSVICAAALRIFSRYGYRKTTMEDIAGELNMTAAAIYAYADSKRELYEQTVRFAMLRWQSNVRAAVAEETTASDKLSRMCHSALYYLTEDREFSALLESDPSIFPLLPAVDPYEDINAASADMLGSVLRLGAATHEFRELDFAAVSNVLFSMYKGFIIRAYVQGESEYLENNLPQALDLVLRGIVR